jgi:predicted NUDIX family phosphoesterase
MSHPTKEQREEWIGNIEHHDDTKQWRYWILKPGQAILFPSGTIHSVFRIRKGQTLGLGGHILQWSGIDQWIDVLNEQVQAPDSTNEDMEDAWKWVPVVEDLVQKRLERIGAVE